MYAATDENGLVLEITTTDANVHDSQEFEKLIEKVKLPQKAKVYGDKAYRSEKSDKLLKEKRLKNRIRYKAVKNKPLNKRQKHLMKQLVNVDLPLKEPLEELQNGLEEM